MAAGKEIETLGTTTEMSIVFCYCTQMSFKRVSLGYPTMASAVVCPFAQQEAVFTFRPQVVPFGDWVFLTYMVIVHYHLILTYSLCLSRSKFDLRSCNLRKIWSSTVYYSLLPLLAHSQLIQCNIRMESADYHLS